MLTNFLCTSQSFLADSCSFFFFRKQVGVTCLGKPLGFGPFLNVLGGTAAWWMSQSVNLPLRVENFQLDF